MIQLFLSAGNIPGLGFKFTMYVSPVKNNLGLP